MLLVSVMTVYCLKYEILKIKQCLFHLFILFLCTKYVTFFYNIHMSTFPSYLLFPAYLVSSRMRVLYLVYALHR